LDTLLGHINKFVAWFLHLQGWIDLGLGLIDTRSGDATEPLCFDFAANTSV